MLNKYVTDVIDQPINNFITSYRNPKIQELKVINVLDKMTPRRQSQNRSKKTINNNYYEKLYDTMSIY